MLLYLESQLHAAYKVYCEKIPEGHEVMDIDKFRDTIELDEEWFEGLLDEFEDNKHKFTVH